MRIAVWWDQDSWGGVDTHLLALLRNWPDKCDQFVIFHNCDNQGVKRISQALAQCSLSQSGRLTLISYSEPSRWLPEPFGKVIRYFAYPLQIFWLKLRIKRILACHKPFDVLFSDNGTYPGAWSCLAALWAAAALKIPIRLLLVHHAAGVRRPLRYSSESLLDVAVQRWATDLVAVSRATRATLLERRGFNAEISPIRVVHNGVDPPVEEETPVAELRALLSIPANSFVVGMVGRLERYKGQEDLILALGELSPDVLAKVIVVFMGGGEVSERRRLEEMAKIIGVDGHVRFTGYMEGHPGMLIRQFDLLASLTKDFEGFGLTIAEAMWVGTPVLATSVGGVPEFVTPEIAVLIPPESPDEIAEALLRIMTNHEAAQLRAKRARQHITKYSGQVMARRFHRLLLTSGRRA